MHLSPQYPVGISNIENCSYVEEEEQIFYFSNNTYHAQ